MPMDLYTPAHQANGHEAKAVRASQHATIHRWR
jgi:hypothetical protein